jgi:hypothetical protein
MPDSEQKRHYQTLAVSVIALIVATIVGVVGYCALQEQHDAAVRSLRAYLGVKSASFAPWKPNEMLVRYDIENFGQTPAYKVRQYLHFDFVPRLPTRSNHPTWTPGTGHAYMRKGVLPNRLRLLCRRVIQEEIRLLRANEPPVDISKLLDKYGSSEAKPKS